MNEGMENTRVLEVGRAGDINEVVCDGGTTGASERPEVSHLAVPVNEGVRGTIRSLRVTGNHPSGIDAVGRARGTTQSPEIRDAIAELSLRARKGEE